MEIEKDKEGTAAIIAHTVAVHALNIAQKIASSSALTLAATIAPLAIAAAAIIGVAVAINAASEAEEKRKETLQKSIETSNNLVNTLKENKDKLDELYSSFVETKEVTEEFRDALLEQADALGISNAEVLVATGQYGTLKKKIDEATEAQLEYNTALLQQQQKTLHTGSSYMVNDYQAEEKLKRAGVNTETVETSGEYGTYSSTMVLDSEYTKLIKFQNTVNDLIDENNKLNKERMDLERQLSNAQAENDKEAEKRLTQEIENLDKKKQKNTELINSYQQDLESDEGRQILENGNQIIDNTIMANQDNEAFKYQAGQSLDEYREQISEFLKSKGLEVSEEILDAYVDGIIGYSATNENAAELAKQKGYEDAQDEFRKNAEKMAGNFRSSMGLFSEEAMAFDRNGGTVAYANSLQQVIESTNLSNEDKMKLYNWID